jgi:hypothetical protein
MFKVLYFSPFYLIETGYISEFHFFHFLWQIKKKFPHNPKPHMKVTPWYNHI